MKKVLMVFLAVLFVSVAFAGNVKVLDLSQKHYFNVENNIDNDLQLSGQFTIDAWIKWNNVSIAGRLITQGANTSGEGFRIFPIVSGGLPVIRFEFSDGTTFQTGEVPIGTWFHFAVSRDGTNTRIFLNGVTQASSAKDLVVSSEAIYIGGSDAFFNPWDAQIDEFRYSNIGRYGYGGYTPPTTPYEKDANTILLYNFDDEATPPTNNSDYTFTHNNNGIVTGDYKDPGDLSLPVTLSSFTAKAVKGTVVLEWETSAEIENQGFVISRQSTVDSQQSEVIASFATDDALKGQGSTTEKTKYSYTDKSVEPGKTYVYTLADVDYAGNETVLEKVEVKVEAEGAVVADGYALSPVYPNPFNASFTVPFSLNKSMNVSVDLYNINGRRVKSITNSSYAEGNHHLTVDADDLSSGTYIVRVTFDGAIHAQKIVLMK